MEPSENEERNLARASMLYVQEDLMASSQRFINTTIMKSLCFAVTRKMLMLDRKLHALKCLNTEFIEPEIEKTPQIREYVSDMDTMDKEGFLTRILLREFSQLDAKLSPALTDPEARKDTKNFTKMLTHFVKRARGARAPSLDYTGAVFRISLLPVAKREKFNIARFTWAVSRCHHENIDTIYVLARGMNVVLAKLVISEIEKARLYLKNTDWEYNIVGRKKGRLESYVAELTKV